MRDVHDAPAVIPKVGGNNDLDVELQELARVDMICLDWRAMLLRGVYLLKIPTFSRKVRVFFAWNWEMLFSNDIASLNFERSLQEPAGAASRKHRNEWLFAHARYALHSGHYLVGSCQSQPLR